jgi:hypothetical protein
LGRSSTIYQNLDEKARSAPWSLLSDFSSQPEIFAPNTKHVLEKASDAAQRTGSEPTKGLVAILLALARGAMRAMGAVTLETVLDLPEASADDIVNTLEKALSSPSLEKNIIRFITMHKGQLHQLAIDVPIYFHWLRPLLQMLGLA